MLLIAACLAVSAPALAAKKPSKADLALQAQLLAHITELASDAYEGREPGTDGESQTLRYLGREWFEIGLESGTNDPGHSWFAPVTLVAREPDGSRVGFSRKGRRVYVSQAAVEAFTSGKVDLVVSRADVGDLSGAQMIVSITRAVVFLITPPGSGITSVAGLRGKTVGVVLADVNRRLVDTLSREYDLAQSHVKFTDVPPNDVPEAFKRHRIEALLVAMPVSPKYMARLRSALPKSRSGSAGLIAIDSAGAIAASNLYYESYDLPAGTLLGSPAVPDDDLTTLRIPYYLLANAKMSDRVGASLAQAIMNARRDLIRDDPLISQISAPNTDKDTPEDLYFPIQSGAAAYFDGSEESFFDQYGDALFYGSMVLGFLASVATAAWKYMMLDENAASRRASARLWSLLGDIRQAQSVDELQRIEDKIDEIVKGEIDDPPGEDDAERQRNLDAMQLVVRRLQHAQGLRRMELAAGSREPADAAREQEKVG